MKTFKSLKHALLVTAAALGATGVVSAFDPPAYAQEAVRSYAIQAQDLNGALREFAMQTGRDVLYAPSIVQGRRSPGVHGSFTETQALRALLAGTGLNFERTASNGYAVRDPNTPSNVADAGAAVDENVTALPEILVEGQRSLNTDIRRTEDDMQPYVVFDSGQIARSNATTVEDFLQSRLPMNTQSATTSQFVGGGGDPSAAAGRVDLRGLGTNQTLILIDGHRIAAPSATGGGAFLQPSLNGIPLAAIERIEVLPSTAGAIYGGSATGGVINVILKRNYSGLDVSVSEGSRFDGRADQSRIDVSGGFSLEDGRTHVMLSASRSDGHDLSTGDVEFLRDRLQTLADRNPTYALSPGGALGGRNICATTDTFAAFASCAPTSLSLDNGTSLNSNRTSVPVGYPGVSVAGDGGAAFLARAGQLDFSSSQPIWTAPVNESYKFSVRREFASFLDAYLDLSRSEQVSSLGIRSLAPIILAANAPENPFQQDILVDVPIPNLRGEQAASVVSTDYGVGAIIKLPADWRASIEYRRSQSKGRGEGESFDVYGLSPAQDALLQGLALTDLNEFPIQNPRSIFTLNNFNSSPTSGELAIGSLRIGGRLLSLPAGPLTLTALVERSRETAGASIQMAFGGYSWNPGGSQVRLSQYAEINAPILNSLQFMAAVRHDEYTTEFNGQQFPIPGPTGPFPAVTVDRNQFESTNYTFGLKYTPTPDLTLRASVASGFLPPALDQLRENYILLPAAILGPVFLLTADPRRGDTPLTGDPTTNLVNINVGGNSDLAPEESKSFSIGTVFTPHFIEGLRVSLDWVSIKKTGEISGIDWPLLLANESRFPDRVVRAANLPGDLPGWAGPIVEFDAGLLNTVRTDVESLDFQVDYTRQTAAFGDWRVYAIGTYQDHFTRRQLDGSDTERVGFNGGGLLSWRGNVGVDWTADAWSAGWNAQYFDKYDICDPGEMSSNAQFGSTSCADKVALQGGRTIPRQIYHDVYVNYAVGHLPFSGNSGATAEISAGIQNLFNESPPLIVPDTAGAFVSGYADPRLRRFQLVLKVHF